jgi:hypothetical protein
MGRCGRIWVVRAVQDVELVGRDRPARPSGRAEGPAVLALQRTAGNRAVAGLLRPPVVQRACGCGTCGGCGGDNAEKDEAAPVQREDEQTAGSATGAQSSAPAAARVESCAGSAGTGAGVDLGIGGDGLGPVPGVDGQTDPGGGTDAPEGIQTPDPENPTEPLAEPVAAATTCKTLSWSDFAESDKSGAFTSYTFKLNGTTFSAEFDSASSYRSKIVEKVFDSHLTDCDSTDFENYAFEIDGKPEATCTATNQPGPAKATKKEECASKIKPLVEAANATESARLLRHEQYHMKMGCVLAAKATAALAAGKKVTTADLTSKNNTQSTSYDSKAQTDHSCNQTSQTAWEADIDAGLPKVTF